MTSHNNIIIEPPLPSLPVVPIYDLPPELWDEELVQLATAPPPTDH